MDMPPFMAPRLAVCAAVLVFLLAKPAAANLWDALKADAGAAGITPTIVYDGIVTSNVSGGAERGNAYAGAAHLQIDIDGAKLFGIPKLTLYADLLNTHGQQPDKFIGDIQGVSNIAAAPDTRIYEAWLQYDWNGASLLIGRYDLNTEFYRLQSSSLFLNSSFGVGPEFSQSGPLGASVYPDTALGARLGYKPTDNVVLRLAIMDGAPVEKPADFGGWFSAKDGLLIASEVAFLLRPGEETRPGAPRSILGRLSSLPPYEDKIALGGWYYTASLDDLSGRGPDGLPISHRGSAGAYALLDKRLFSYGAAFLTGFVQAGLGDARVERIGSYVGLGLAANGFLPGRPNDQMGIALASANTGSHFLRASPTSSGNETTLELTYVCRATDSLAFQPDMQFVWHPGAIPGLRSALVFQLEVETAF